MRPLRAGIATRDITPPAGLLMSGFGARTAPAVGSHDPLRATALVIDDTVLVALDLLAVDGTLAREITADCARLGLAPVVAATHTHGGPACLVGELDPDYRDRLVAAARDAIAEAAGARRPAVLRAGIRAGARGRAQPPAPGGTTDQVLPVLAVDASDGRPIATMVAYACHPTVLGADNLLWTADWHAPLRAALEAARPGAIAMTLTGCAGDATVGHSAHSSVTLASLPTRTFAAAGAAAARIAECAAAARLAESSSGSAAASATVALGFARRESEPDEVLAASWRAAAVTADPAHRPLFETWADWAETNPSRRVAATIEVPVSALRWGDVEIVALPGEIFAETAIKIRHRLGNPEAIVFAYAGDTPGYIPPRSEYAAGGYEVDEAHRYYGQPATFAPGSAERLADTAVVLVSSLPKRTPR